MNILLKGYYGFGNLGDDILMLVSFLLLKSKYPKAEISVYSNNTNINQDTGDSIGYNLYINKILGNRVEIIDWTFKGEFDLVFHGGGGVYFDNTYSIFSNIINLLIYTLSIKQVVLLDKVLRKLSGKPHHIIAKERIGMGIGIGKYKNGSTQLFYDLAEIGMFKKLIVRDDFSFNFLKRNKFSPENFDKNTDLAFLNSWNNRPFKIRSEVSRIGIVIKSNLPNALEKTLFDFYKKKSAEGYKVTFLLFDKTCDYQIEKRCLGYNFVSYNPLNLEEFLEQLNQQDVLISSRAHGVILGACLGIPSIVLNTEIKLEQVSNMFPQGCLRVDDFEYSTIQNKFEHLTSNYESIIIKLQKELLHHQNLAGQLSKEL